MRIQISIIFKSIQTKHKKQMILSQAHLKLKRKEKYSNVRERKKLIRH